jgi:uncharacterized YigZ family protein
MHHLEDGEGVEADGSRTSAESQWEAPEPCFLGAADGRFGLEAGIRANYTSDMILSVGHRGESTLKVLGSRFLAFAIPVDSEDEARKEIAALEKEYADATHCCFAYRVERGGAPVERSSDAGEPAGSAGAPILQVIKGRGLENLVVVVVRYFGGTKLGIGGLARAYREAAKSALDAGEVRQREPARRLRVVLPLALVGEARSQLARLGGEVVSEAYALEVAELCVTLSESRADELRRSLDELTRGAARWPAGEEMPGGRS